ncbi:class I SAM-dependent methyltransferase [Roseicella aquatilis]|uniref:Class I SAM-dependent methyltransferase n=1 Tax=Roseicella aquatilis TaxID=2527868 RepID=A0A4R4DQL8_9PROT|nr:class I SAM-dependent methyltransferase [Roseicella aquatilis]TCZ63196.1 class I SAM-dependent methyltransferase [Roseicella aquatilis]
MAIQAHNEKAAATWGSGGAAYDRISECIADAIEHMLNRCEVRPGERALDLATGTGWTARRLARKGAEVTGLDIGAGVIEAAEQLAAAANLRIDFRVGDAEQVELPDAGFDLVTSTFGVMFASRPEAAAAELARLCRPGGRLGLVTWTPTSTIAGVFQVMRPYMPAPPNPAPPSPFEWGREERVRQWLGDAFDLQFETGTTVFRVPSGEAAWELFSTGYGPTRTLLAATDRKEALKRDFIAFHEAHRTPMGIAMPRDYLVTIGRRR